MKAIILAAGRGERLRPLTDETPKPLIYAGKKRLIEYHLENLARVGITEIVINVSYKVEDFLPILGTGEKYGVDITYSVEQPKALETGGGILNALPLLGDKPFIAISADVWADYPLEKLVQKAANLGSNLAHLVLVPNPSFRPQGDFGLEQDLITAGNAAKFTYANLGVYAPALFKDCHEKAFKLAPLLYQAIAEQKISGELYSDAWFNIGTHEQLNALRKHLWKLP